ncbi:hypothetical protein AB9P05_01140 [Roseivirga sp. BDSF3-8]|uniref:hypothetical protein n=1 Tax=Roseivirga sp. BDSF3-8 TaxID=3241598 RepID=UPI003531F55A
MKTRLLMKSAAIFFGIGGVMALFLPQEASSFLGVAPDPVTDLMFQLLGGAWAGLGLLNWMGRGNLIGGIYSRPVAMANLTYFAIATLSMGRYCMSYNQGQYVLIPVLVIHALFMACFGYIAFTHPIAKKV